MGLAAEQKVIEHFQKQNYVLRFQRWKSPFAEVDLVFQAPGFRKFLLVEVKRNAHPEFRHLLISKRQKARLKRTAEWLMGYRYSVEIMLVVQDENQILIEMPEELLG